MPIKDNYVEHAVKILQIIFSKKPSFSNFWNNYLRTYEFIFKMYISGIAWVFLFILRVL